MARGHQAPPGTGAATARRARMRLWVRGAGSELPRVLIDNGDGDGMHARLRELREEGVEAMIRPAAEGAAHVGAMFEEHAQQRVIARERAGEGALPSDGFGIEVVDRDRMPEGFLNTHAWFGPNERDEEVEAFWANAEPLDLASDQPICGGQAHVSPTALAQMDLPSGPGTVVWPELPRVVSADGRHWIVDGYHRIARARQEGRTVRVVCADYERALADGWFEALAEQ